jgi:nitrate/nitrite transporter NarK
LSPIGWRSGILGFSGMAVLGVLVFSIFYRGGTHANAGPVHAHAIESSGRKSDSGLQNRSAFRTPVVWALAVLIGIVGLGQFSTNFFVPSAAKAAYGLDPVAAAYIISTGYFFAIFVNILFGRLMDRFNKWIVMSVLVFLMIPAGFAMSVHNLIVFRIATAAVLAFGMTAINQVYAISGEVLTGRETGNVMGVVSLGAGIFGYIGPQVLGLLRDWTGGFSAGWFMVGSVATLAFVEILILKHHSARARSRMATSDAAV